MEKSSYQLRIDVDEKYYELISSILDLKPVNYKYGWSYEIILEEEPGYFNIIEKFLKHMYGKYEKLKELGVERENITIWIIYGYNNQCNMEFTPYLLKQLGDNGISLCISCYEAGNE